MKKLILVISLIVLTNFQGFAQDPELFKTWHLREVQNDFFSIFVENIAPPIFPTLTLTETLSFYGEAACNTYSGTMSYDSATDLFEVLSFERTNNTCIEPTHENFEQEFFMFFDNNFNGPFHAYAWIDSNGEQNLGTIGAYYPLLFLKNFALDVPENNKLNIAVYPNPVAETLHIASEGITIEIIKVYSISGQLILASENSTNTIDVSGLSEGIYFLEIFTSEGSSIQKFIKN